MESFVVEGMLDNGLRANSASGGERRLGPPDELRSAVAEFESLFIYQMLKIMRESVMKSDLLPSGSQKDIYTSMMDTELSKVLASGEGLGLGRILLDQLSRSEDVDASTQGVDKPLFVPLPMAAGEYRKGSEANRCAATGKAESALLPAGYGGKDAGGVERETYRCGNP